MVPVAITPRRSQKEVWTRHIALSVTEKQSPETNQGFGQRYAYLYFAGIFIYEARFGEQSTYSLVPLSLGSVSCLLSLLSWCFSMGPTALWILYLFFLPQGPVWGILRYCYKALLCGLSGSASYISGSKQTSDSVDSRNSNVWFYGTDTVASPLHPCMSMVHTAAFVLQGLWSLRGSMALSFHIDSKWWAGEILQARKWWYILDHIISSFCLCIFHIPNLCWAPVPLTVQ